MILRLRLTASSTFRRFSRPSCMVTDGRTVTVVRVEGTQPVKTDIGIVGLIESLYIRCRLFYACLMVLKLRCQVIYCFLKIDDHSIGFLKRFFIGGLLSWQKQV